MFSFFYYSIIISNMMLLMFFHHLRKATISIVKSVNVVCGKFIDKQQHRKAHKKI